MSLAFRSAVDIAADVQAGTRSAQEVTEAVLDRIEARNDFTNAYVTVLADEARERAREVDAALADGADLPLAGVPVGMKDLSMTKAGVTHTMGLAPFADNVATDTSTIIRRLEDAGAIVVGTTNTPELGHRVRTDNPLVGPTGTPFDPDRNAGGSSGGSAAALADGLCALATGSDVGGSLRNPAACCGVVSVKPSFGLVPRDLRPNAYSGHIPYNVWGPMARDIRSLARMFDVITGQTNRDPHSIPTPDRYEPTVQSPPDPSELRIAHSPDLDLFAVEASVRESVAATVDDLAAAGATVEDVTIDAPAHGELAHVFSVTATASFATAVEGINDAFGIDLLEDHGDEISSELSTVVQMGRSTELIEYLRTDHPRTALYDAVDATLEGYDALVCPTLATPPLTHEEPLPTEIDGQNASGLPTDWTLAWPFNLTGHPVVHVPATPADGLPIGMQVVGNPYTEPRLLQVAAAFEAASPWSYPDE